MRVITEEIGKQIVEMYQNKTTLIDISRYFGGSPGADTIRKYLREINVFKPRLYYGKYSYEDCLKIGELYQQDKWDEIYQLFPDLTKQTVYTICSKLQIKKENYFWSKEDTQLLINCYGKMSSNELATLMNNRHSSKAINTKAIKMGLASSSPFWSNEENDIITKYYPTIPIDDVCKMLPKRTYDSIICHAQVLGLTSYRFLNEKYTHEQKQFIRDNWQVMTDAEIADIIGKTPRGVMEQRNAMNLYRINKEYAGYENLAKLFRGHIQEWKTKSMEACNYKCIFTGDKCFIVHHIYGFNKILEEALYEINKIIPIISDDVKDYPKEELDIMIEIFTKIHNKYPLGVCVRKDIHDLFHRIYGSGGNTQEQWEVFKEKFLNGEYDLAS